MPTTNKVPNIAERSITQPNNISCLRSEDPSKNPFNQHLIDAQKEAAPIAPTNILRSSNRSKISTTFNSKHALSAIAGSSILTAILMKILPYENGSITPLYASTIILGGFVGGATGSLIYQGLSR